MDFFFPRRFFLTASLVQILSFLSSIFTFYIFLFVCGGKKNLENDWTIVLRFFALLLALFFPIFMRDTNSFLFLFLFLLRRMMQR